MVIDACMELSSAVYKVEVYNFFQQLGSVFRSYIQGPAHISSDQAKSTQGMVFVLIVLDSRGTRLRRSYVIEKVNAEDADWKLS